MATLASILTVAATAFGLHDVVPMSQDVDTPGSKAPPNPRQHLEREGRPRRHITHHHRHHRRRHHPVFQTAVASYYDYAGASSGACGALYPDGVANKTLPCGTRLIMCATRCAEAVVDDRGPYVWGRDFDLSETLAEAIGFNMGVEPIRWRFA